MALADEKKLTIIFRVEAGCLGPEGASHVSRFCAQALKVFNKVHSEFLNWQVVPRDDKSLPELGYSIGARPLAREHAAKYLNHFNIQIDEFEMGLFDQLPEMIDQYFGR